MKQNLANLIKVKTIVTVAVTAVFAVLALTDKIASQDVMQIMLIVTAFYFGTQTEKANR